MGGRSPTTPERPPRTPCPETIETVLSGPVEDIVPNSWLDVVVNRSPKAARVVVMDPVTQRPVGTLAGIPELAVLIRCIERGVEYRAYVSAVTGGRVDLIVTRQ